MRGHCFVNGVEKHVKCAYVGVNGKAQYIMKPPGVIKYGGNIEPLTDHKRDISASINESYTIFASGFIPKSKNDSAFDSGITKLKTADAYDNKYYTKTKCSNISNTWRYKMFGLKLSKYALFIGGFTGGNSTETKYMDAYDDSLVHTSSSTFLTYKTYGKSSYYGNSPVINDTYAIIPAQSSSQKSNDNKQMMSIDTNLTVSNLADRPITIRVSCLGHVTNYALFGCGYEFSDDTKVKEKSMIAYNTSLTQIHLPDMNYSYYSRTKSANAGDSIIFFGDSLNGETAPIDAYNNHLTKMSIEPPDYYKKKRTVYAYISGSIKNYAFFGGSNVSNYRNTSTVYDENLIKISGPTMDTWIDYDTVGISNNTHLMATGGSMTESPYAVNTVSSYIMSDGYIP